MSPGERFRDGVSFRGADHDRSGTVRIDVSHDGGHVGRRDDWTFGTNV